MPIKAPCWSSRCAPKWRQTNEHRSRALHVAAALARPTWAHLPALRGEDVSTATQTKPKARHYFTSIWAIGPNKQRLPLIGVGPGIRFEYEHAEDCPDPQVPCRPMVTVAGWATKRIVRMSRPKAWAHLVPGDSITFEDGLL